jgi:hypothetical protein
LPVGSLFLPFDGQILPETRLSDHASFWDAGLPALMVTDTAFFLSPNYHLPNDTINTLDFTFMAQLSKASSSRSLNFSHYSSRAAISSSGLSLALLHLPRPFVSRPRHLWQLEHHHLKHIGIDMLGIGFHGVVNHCFNPGIARTVRAFLRDGLFERIEHRPEPREHEDSRFGVHLTPPELADGDCTTVALEVFELINKSPRMDSESSWGGPGGNRVAI